MAEIRRILDDVVKMLSGTSGLPGIPVTKQFVILVENPLSNKYAIRVLESMYACTRACVCARELACVRCVYMWCERACVYMCKCVHMYACVCTCMYVCVNVCNVSTEKRKRSGDCC